MEAAFEEEFQEIASDLTTSDYIYGVANYLQKQFS